MRRTPDSPTPTPRACRVVCTLGPSSTSSETLDAMVRAGMNVARLNFSHGTHESHRATADLVREVANRNGTEVALLQDLQGHKVRVGRPEGDGKIALERGARVLVGHGEAISTERIGIDYERVAEFVEVDDSIYLDDGSIELRVLGRRGDDIECEVLVAGDLGARKGVIFPDADLDFPLIEDRDLEDAQYGVELGVDMVAMSFVRTATEVREMRRRLRLWGCETPFLVSKIEDRLGVRNIDDITAVSDAILIARGDLGVTLPRETVPGIQKRIVRSCNRHGVPVITATQMLETMVTNRKPTRAEVSDVYNAVIDGTDAVMLSGETAAGDWPVQAVEEMDRICRGAEEHLRAEPHGQIPEGRGGLHDHIAVAAASLVRRIDAACVLGFSLSGSMLRSLSAARPGVPVFGVVDDPSVMRRLLLHHGVYPFVLPRKGALHEVLEPALSRLEREGRVVAGDRVVVAAGNVEPGGRRTVLVKVYEL